MLTVGLFILATAGLAFLLVVIADLGLTSVLVCLFFVLASFGIISPNASALALNDFPHAAGSASAVLGGMQFVIAAIAAPLVGLGGTHNVLPMALVISSLGVAGLTVRLVSRSTARRLAIRVPAAVPAESGTITTEATPL
jgi:DHA1 family bicyclomycin/chloramphenicol resistance-like MFS transporter